MLDPTTIASLALATVTAALGVVAWLEGRPDRSGSAVGWGSADKTGYILDYPRARATGALPPPGAQHQIGSPAYNRIANQLATDIATEAAGIRPWRNIVTPADITSAPSQPPKRRAF